MISLIPEEFRQRHAELESISLLMKRGIQKNRQTDRAYFTGYSYNTLYDWDQYFESVLQIYLGWGTTYLKNGVLIFLDQQEEDGFIVRRVPGGKLQERSMLDPVTQAIMQEEDQEMIKPFLAQMILLAYKHDRNLDFLTPFYYERLKKYLGYYFTELNRFGSGLAVWNSGPHSGMDDQIERIGDWGSCFCEGTDLNCFLLRECKAMALIADIMGYEEDAANFVGKSKAFQELILERFWCEEEGIFYDRDGRSGEFIRVKSSACFAPLWAGVPSKEQAERIVKEHLLNPLEFWRAFPISSYAATEPGYREERHPNDVGCNFRAHTWIQVNYYIMHGLLDYGYADIAKAIADKSYEMVKQLGSREYYNSDSCTGNGLDPFWGWTLLAYFMPIECETQYDPTSIKLSYWDLIAK